MKPLHRSLRFWLGLLPGIFILWAWFDSYGHMTIMHADIRGRSVQISQYWKRLDINFTYEPYRYANWGFHRESARLRERDVQPPRFFFETTKEEDPEVSGYRGKFTNIAIPHWMLFTGWLVLILIFLAARRMLHHKRGRAPLEVPVTSIE